MTEDDGVRVGKAGAEALQAALGGTGIVDQRQGDALELHGESLGQLPAKLGAVHVAVDGGDGAQLTQLGEHRRVAKVAGVDDQIGRAKRLKTGIG